MSERKDLTRWNRAGLSRFTYVDGNAVEYLEKLRQELGERFPDAEWLAPLKPMAKIEEPEAGEALLDEQQRLQARARRILQMYRGDRRDWGWEISRTFARACHILTGYADAWANEGYLGTATQWGNVRRLVGLLDYHPAPPASATTPLVLMAKKGMSGTVAKGFQVKNNPAMGAEKVVFETLNDLFIDEKLNMLRPKGWGKSDKPALDIEDAEPRQFSELASLPTIHLQGMSSVWADALASRANDAIKIIGDFFDTDPENLADTGLGLDRLWEFKAKAMTVCNFQPGSEWAAIFESSLPEIVLADPASLAKLTGNPLESVEALQLSVALLGMCLDQTKYREATLKQLRVSVHSVAYLLSPWRAGVKPRVEAGQVALVCRKSGDKPETAITEAEAVAITKVDAGTRDIHVQQGQIRTWSGWTRGEAVLRVVPRLKRKCWLNGGDVVRTNETHGLAAGAYVCWKGKGDEYQYAKIVKADKRSLQLELGGKSKMPGVGTEIMVALPIDTEIMSADLEAINAGAAKADVKEAKLEPPAAPDLPFEVYKIFQPIPSAAGSGGGGGGLLPPASLPGIGSFLFPSPFLPIDLVKAAIEMMLSLGVMVIPSTGKPVFKGMPFGGLLEGADTKSKAATKMVELLDNLVLPAKWSDGFLVDTLGKPVYLEETGSAIVTRRKYVSSAGVEVVPLCINGKIVHEGKPVGFQPHHTELGITNKPGDGAAYSFQMVAWDDKTAKTEAMEDMLAKADAAASILFKSIAISATNGADTLPEPLLAVLKGATVTRATVASNSPLYVFDGAPDNIAAGDWVVGQFEGDVLGALKTKTVEDCSGEGAEKAFSLTFDNVPGGAGRLEKIHADFSDERIAEDAGNNTTPLEDKIELTAVPKTLSVGRKVLLTTEGGKPVEAKIASIDGNTIVTAPPPKGFTKGKLIICANVVTSGHGVAKPPAILGSGDAAKANQEFTLEVQGVSFTPDATMSSGVAAALDVEVAGRIWEQVSTLRNSAPHDHHYAVRMTEEGYVKIVFGDGRNGRRLPSGKNNVRVRYRVGSGLSGNLVAHSLEKPVSPHPLVESVLQPVQAAGGGDMESVASLRENAPSTLLALERAVSLSDFASLAVARSNVWQAHAGSGGAQAGGLERVKVTIVPADGVWSNEVGKDVCSFLQAHALPGVQVSVHEFGKAAIEMKVTIRIKSAEYFPVAIVNAVEAALLDHFSLKRRKLGANLYLSEIYKIVEGVKGVENSVCRFKGNNSQVIEAGNLSTVVYLEPPGLRVDWEEFVP